MEQVLGEWMTRTVPESSMASLAHRATRHSYSNSGPDNIHATNILVCRRIIPIYERCLFPFDVTGCSPSVFRTPPRHGLSLSIYPPGTEGHVRAFREFRRVKERIIAIHTTKYWLRYFSSNVLFNSQTRSGQGGRGRARGPGSLATRACQYVWSLEKSNTRDFSKNNTQLGELATHKYGRGASPLLTEYETGEVWWHKSATGELARSNVSRPWVALRLVACAL